MFPHQLKWFSRISHPHDDRFSLSFQLNGLQAFFRKEDFILWVTHKCAFHFPPLQHDQSVNMRSGIDTASIRIGSFTDHPADFTVTDGSGYISGKGKVSRKDEIPGQLFISIMKLVFIEPDIRARTFYGISLGGFIVA